MKIYTKTGDKGITSLYGGTRLGKDTIFFDILGESDELSSRVGYLHALIQGCDNVIADPSEARRRLRSCDEICAMLRTIQVNLQDLNTILAASGTSKKLPSFTNEKVQELESIIDALDSQNPRLTKFILPGVAISDSQAHSCRTQVRKVERYLYRLHNSTSIIETSEGEKIDLTVFQIDDIIRKYINRLSDFFFVLARWICYSIEEKEDACK